MALQLFSSPAFVGLNGELANKLGVSLDRHDIRNMIIREAENQKSVERNAAWQILFSENGCLY